MPFLARVVEEARRRGALLDLALVDKEELMGDLKVSGSLGCSAPEMVELRMRRGGSRAKSQDHSPGFQESRLPPRPRPQLCSLLWPGPALGTSWWQQGDGRRRGKRGVGRHVPRCGWGLGQHCQKDSGPSLPAACPPSSP